MGANEKYEFLDPNTVDLEMLYAEHGMPLLGNTKSPEEEYVMFTKLSFRDNPEN